MMAVLLSHLNELIQDDPMLVQDDTRKTKAETMCPDSRTSGVSSNTLCLIQLNAT